MNDTSRTALVTGASMGLGRAFADRLASQGMNLVLVARGAEELNALARDLEKRHAVGATVAVADLSNNADVTRIEDLLRGLRVDLLVNNAGFGTVGHFVDVGLARHLQMVELHVKSPLRLTYAILPGMIKRRRGNIINVCSVNAFLPGHATYSATKSFLRMFSEALAIELQGTGVKVQALCPGFTRTSFHDAPDFQAAKTRERVPRFLWTSPEAVVERSLADLEKGRVICIPTLTYRLIVAAHGNRLSRFLVQLGSRLAHPKK